MSQTTIIAPCTQCHQPFPLIKKHQRARFKQGKAVYCSDECRRERCSHMASKTMASTNRRYASARMKAHNPMQQEVSRQKMRATLFAMGHKPKTRGGNGSGPTHPQQLLAQA